MGAVQMQPDQDAQLSAASGGPTPGRLSTKSSANGSCPFQANEANQLRLWLAKRGRRIDYIFGMVSVNEALGIEILAGILALAFGERGWRVVLWLVCGAVLIAGVNTIKALWWRL